MAGIQRETYSASISIKTVGKPCYELSTNSDDGRVDTILHNFTELPSCSSFLFSSLAVGSKAGYKLFSLNSVEKLEEIYEYGKYI